MGKKSKSKQRSGAAKAKAVAAPQDVTAPVAGDIVGGILASSGSKKLKCSRCYGSIKDFAKAHQCPGCSVLFCWRCERKSFEECPNGDMCVCPTKRCNKCSCGITMDTLIGLCEKVDEVEVPPERRIAFFEEFIEAEKVKRLTTDAIPFQECGAKGCMRYECYHCLMHSANTALFHCVVCQRIRCYDCKTADMNANPPTREVMALIGASAGASAGGDAVTSDQMDAAIQSIRRDTPDKWVACSECNASFCYGCLDDVSARSLMTSWASNGQDFGAAALSSLLTQTPGRIKSTNRFRCSNCYWKSKPCTNPSCPNEVGVPTKRCGGCHLDRYCSVECQAAAYPDHSARCKKIQEKRAAADKQAG